MANEHDSFIREVNEELRSEQFRHVWRRFGKIIIATAVIIVLGTAGYRGYEYWLETQASASGDRFLAAFAPPYAAETLSYPPGDAAAPGAVAGRISEGRLLVAYFGHGSVTQWGKDRLLSSADAPALAPGDRLPIIINMTCLTGLFIHPRQESLAETLLWQPRGGAVALLAPTSLTLPTDQRALSDGLAEAFAGQRIPTLGKALLHAQRRLAADAPVDGADVLQTFLLFGDPALPIAYAAP